MRIINLCRGTGKTTMLIHTSYITGIRIVTETYDKALLIKEQAEQMGLDIPQPICMNEFRNKRNNEYTILFDEVESILGTALSNYLGSDVYACTCSIPMLEIKKEEKG